MLLIIDLNKEVGKLAPLQLLIKAFDFFFLSFLGISPFSSYRDPPKLVLSNPEVSLEVKLLLLFWCHSHSFLTG